MTHPVLKDTLHVDESHQLHITIPAEMGSKVDVIVFPSVTPEKNVSDSIDMARIFDESGFAKDILNSTEEDCWNDL